MQARLETSARAACDKGHHAVERVYPRIPHIGRGMDQHVVEQCTVAFFDVLEGLNIVCPALHRAPREPRSRRLIAKLLVHRLFVGGRVVRLLIARLRGRGRRDRISHVEHTGLIAGHSHRHQLRHHPVTGRGAFRILAHLKLHRRLVARLTRGNRVRLCQTLFELLLQMTQAREVLIKALLVFRTNLVHQPARVIHNPGQNTLADHYSRVRREVFRIGVRELRSKQTGIKSRW